VDMFKLPTGSFQAAQPVSGSALKTPFIHQRQKDDSTWVTVLNFEKLLVEADPNLGKINKVGPNVFFWALGPSDAQGLSAESEKGALLLDFTAIKEKAGGGTSTGGTDATPTNGQTTNGGSTGANTAAIVTSLCAKTSGGYDKKALLTPTLTMYWQLTPSDLRVQLVLQDKAWLAFGISEGGQMVGSTAVIGLPEANTVQEYVLDDKSIISIQTLADQTIKDTSLTQSDGKTVLSFRKPVTRNGQTIIRSSGLSTFIYAIGSTNTFAYHEHRGSFRLDLGSQCSDSTLETPVGSRHKTHMTAWAAHGILATLAWAVASPFAITTAWFRTLVPSSWIYIHVFSHVIAFFLTFVTVIIALVTMSMEKHSRHFSDPHHWAGVLLLLAVTFQVMNGFLRPPVEKRDPYTNPYEEPGGLCSFPTSPRAFWHFTHRVIGLGLLCTGIWQMQRGLTMYAEDFGAKSVTPYFWGYVGVFGATVLIVKCWIMLEEYKARRGMEAISTVDHRGMQNVAAHANGGHHDNDMVPVQFDMH